MLRVLLVVLLLIDVGTAAIVDYEIGSEIRYDKEMEIPFHSLQAIIRGAELGKKGAACMVLVW